MEPLLLKLDDAAKLCSVSRAKLYKMVHLGEIPAVKFGRTLRIPYQGLKQSIEFKSGVLDRPVNAAEGSAPDVQTGRGSRESVANNRGRARHKSSKNTT